MMTTYDRFITSNPEQKKKFDQEYNDFVISELILAKMAEKKLSVRTLAKKAAVSPTIVQKLKGNNAKSVNYRTLTSVMSALDYQLTFVPKSHAHLLTS
jgi:DNA-binding Xre family transcriptional regulator